MARMDAHYKSRLAEASPAVRDRRTHGRRRADAPIGSAVPNTRRRTAQEPIRNVITLEVRSG